MAYIAIFLYMIDHVGKSLRPVSILTRIGRLGQKVIESVYPHRLEASAVADTPTNVALPPVDASSRTVAGTHSGVVLAFDPAGLMDLSRGDDCLIEFVPQVGDFVAYGFGCMAAALTTIEKNQSAAIPPERWDHVGLSCFYPGASTSPRAATQPMKIR